MTVRTPLCSLDGVAVKVSKGMELLTSPCSRTASMSERNMRAFMLAAEDARIGYGERMKRREVRS